MENNTALVTGASSGIGQGTAIVLAEHGYDLAITYGSNEQGGLETKAQIEALGRRCFLYQATFDEAGVAEETVRRAARDLGRLCLLVNNAAMDRRNSILTVTRAQIESLANVNFTAYCLAAGEAARSMVRAGVAGSIIFITSTRGESAHPDDFLYGGLKAAINRASQSMALDLSPYGIRVNCIAPGATQVRPPSQAPGRHLKNPSGYPLENYIPLHRLGVPRDTGELIAFLASDKGSYITGEIIRVDGGLTLPGMPEWHAPMEWMRPGWVEEQRRGMDEME